MRLLRLAGKGPEYVKYARHFRCDVCERRAPPGSVRPASAWQRPRSFGEVVAVDTKEFVDSDGGRFYGLNIVDVATRYVCLIPLEDEGSKAAATAFCQGWIAWAGPPRQVLADQGTEFKKHFSELLQNFGVPMRCTAAASPWQHSVAERHGKVLGEIVDALVEEMSLSGPHDMAHRLHRCSAAVSLLHHRPVGFMRRPPSVACRKP